MIVAAFLNWATTARSADRAKAASALARAYLLNQLDGEQRAAALIAMAHLVSDPSAKVRIALANALARSGDAPRHIILALANDQPDVAGEVLIYSPCLNDDDLIEIAAVAAPEIQALLASRVTISKGLAAALCEIVDAEAVLLLLSRGDVVVGTAALNRLAQCFAADVAVRAELLNREDLPLTARQALLMSVTKDMASSEFLSACLGKARLAYMVDDAERHAHLTLFEASSDGDVEQLLEAMFGNDRLNVDYLICLAALGMGEVVAACLARITHSDRNKLRKTLSSARLPMLLALFGKADVPASAAQLLAEISIYWRGAVDYDPLGALVQHLHQQSVGRIDLIERMGSIALIDRLVQVRRFDRVQDDVRQIQRFAA